MSERVEDAGVESDDSKVSVSIKPPRMRYGWFRAELERYGVPASTAKRLWRLARKAGREASKVRIDESS